MRAETYALPQPEDPAEFLLDVRGDIVTNSDNNSVVTIGNLTAQLVPTSEAVDAGVNPACVADSRQELLQAYLTVFDVDGEPHEGLEIEPFWQEFMYITSVSIVPEYQQSNAAAKGIAALIRAFGSRGVIAAERELLPMKIWSELGFKRIAGSQIVYRDMWAPIRKSSPRSRSSAAKSNQRTGT